MSRVWSSADAVQRGSRQRRHFCPPQIRPTGSRIYAEITNSGVASRLPRTNPLQDGRGESTSNEDVIKSRCISTFSVPPWGSHDKIPCYADIALCPDRNGRKSPVNRRAFLMTSLCCPRLVEAQGRDHAAGSSQRPTLHLRSSRQPRMTAIAVSACCGSRRARALSRDRLLAWRHHHHADCQAFGLPQRMERTPRASLRPAMWWSFRRIGVATSILNHPFPWTIPLAVVDYVRACRTSMTKASSCSGAVAAAIWPCKSRRGPSLRGRC